ncbi:hypothetical protein GOARA_061_01480 [Gordonia araii NBRC 100433]|uniref:DUF559 domain-containing protein n=1 Tax=Gordonia araii NBRC 100433 TaxID=1073574 RepID=G7H4D3_9ACTN|nr:hypothetical protein [Gordonia araii]NNG96234.1 hypothetical protein [Gordonia araii NBRC 100433]GAB10708.1 hypothetical protein GOARA_061_01480 [Gordonia araii NBRC 100433]
MTRFPLDDYGLVRRGNALAADHCDDELSAAVRSGRLLRLTPGVYVEGSDDFDGPRGAEQLFRLRSIAVATSSTPQRYPLSHTSAAVVHGLPLLHPSLRHVHVTTGEKRGGGIRSGRHLHPAALGSGDVVEIDGVRVTSLERTAADVATMGDFSQALTVFDGALRAGGRREPIAAALATPRPGIRPARRALAVADPASESVGESWSRAQIIDAGLPAPVLQREVRGLSGRTYRCDFGWDDMLVGEFDGLMKYGRLRRPDEDAADAVIREKKREDDLRSMGFIVIRWTWTTLRSGDLIPMLTTWLSRHGVI